MFYQLLVYLHLLLFVFWLGADAGVFLLGQHFRRRRYDLSTRLTLLKLLVALDMLPRSAWALMVPSSLSLVVAGGWAQLPSWLLWVAWGVGGAWLYLVWDGHLHDGTQRAKTVRRLEQPLKWLVMLFYLWLGVVSVETQWPLQPAWLAWKALLFGVIFFAAIMIDLRFKPVGPLLTRLIQEGSSDVTETPLLAAMNRTRAWVFAIYALLVVTSFLGNAKPL